MKIKIALVTTGLLFFLCSVVMYGAAIQGKLLDLNSAPLPNMPVKIEAIEVKPVETITAADGSFKFDDLTSKNWKITINDENWESINLEIRILSDTETVEHNLIAWKKPVLDSDLSTTFFKAYERYSAKAYDEAITEIDKIFQAGLSIYNIYALKGSILFDQQKYAEAIPLLKTALQMNPYETSCNQKLANYEYDNKNYKDSLPYYEKILYANPTNPDLYVEIGEAYYYLKNWEKAVEYYQNAVKYFGTSANAAHADYSMGECYLYLRNYEGALKAFEAFIALSPNDSRITKTKMLVEKLKEAIEKKGKKN
jgi:tetratricopeptide (TPR) repeat protein